MPERRGGTHGLDKISVYESYANPANVCRREYLCIGGNGRGQGSDNCNAQKGYGWHLRTDIEQLQMIAVICWLSNASIARTTGSPSPLSFFCQLLWYY